MFGNRSDRYTKNVCYIKNRKKAQTTHTHSMHTVKLAGQHIIPWFFWISNNMISYSSLLGNDVVKSNYIAAGKFESRLPGSVRQVNVYVWFCTSWTVKVTQMHRALSLAEDEPVIVKKPTGLAKPPSKSWHRSLDVPHGICPCLNLKWKYVSKNSTLVQFWNRITMDIPAWSVVVWWHDKMQFSIVIFA